MTLLEAKKALLVLLMSDHVSAGVPLQCYIPTFKSFEGVDYYFSDEHSILYNRMVEKQFNEILEMTTWDEVYACLTSSGRELLEVMDEN